jgi:Zinc carboxypeptidase
MKLNQLTILSLICFGVLLSACKPPVETVAPVPAFLLDSSQNQTPTYAEGMAFWNEMADHYEEINIFEFGQTDAGIPLHAIVVSNEKWTMDVTSASDNILLISNAIHAGEPDGVDASMLLVHELMTDDQFRRELGNTQLIIIPFYNIGGALNRNSTTRTNQNGPVEYGFRGNAQNLDLNRDYVKCDSKNAESFAKLIQLIDPDLYIETHVSNGADYQYPITYLATQEDKIGSVMGRALRENLTPYLVKSINSDGFEMCPYVNVHSTPPDDGFTAFYDQPRYSTGYLSLFGIPGYITETHMLKPYSVRVKATLSFLKAGLKIMQKFDLNKIKAQNREEIQDQLIYPIDWAIDYNQAKAISFNGYEYGYKMSEVTGIPRMYYDRDQPYTRPVPYYGWMSPTKQIEAPEFYVLKRGFTDVEKRLINNGVELVEFEKDTTMFLEVYHIDTFTTNDHPYEKHYFHSKVKLSKDTQKVFVQKGDLMILLNDYHKRFVIEVLEPEAPDSYFNWNYFDAILQQKEWYSPYVFEDEAAQLLKSDSVLRKQFEYQKLNSEFAMSAQAQLSWIHRHSNRYEKSHLRYPVYRKVKI